jgi:hypothetical protein
MDSMIPKGVRLDFDGALVDNELVLDRRWRAEFTRRDPSLTSRDVTAFPAAWTVRSERWAKIPVDDLALGSARQQCADG